jgi:ribonuclease Z
MPIPTTCWGNLGNPNGGTMQGLRGIAACVWKRQGDEGDQDHHRHDSCQEATGEDGDCFEVGDMKLECFDIQSTKEKQFGFRAELPSSDESGKPLVLACLGDEPYNELNRRYIVGADWMMCEAFCLYADRDTFKPYEKCHSTALDAGKLAEELGVKNLILYHTEEKTLANRKENYTREAAENFKGRIFVPDDLEVIEL